MMDLPLDFSFKQHTTHSLDFHINTFLHIFFCLTSLSGDDIMHRNNFEIDGMLGSGDEDVHLLEEIFKAKRSQGSVPLTSPAVMLTPFMARTWAAQAVEPIL